MHDALVRVVGEALGAVESVKESYYELTEAVRGPEVRP
jgi:hypothetical protein